MIGGGKISVLGGTKTLTLSTSDGSTNFEIKDSDGFPIFKVDSKGNIYARGGVKKI